MKNRARGVVLASRVLPPATDTPTLATLRLAVDERKVVTSVTSRVGNTSSELAATGPSSGGLLPGLASGGRALLMGILLLLLLLGARRVLSREVSWGGCSPPVGP